MVGVIHCWCLCLWLGCVVDDECCVGLGYGLGCILWGVVVLL